MIMPTFFSLFCAGAVAYAMWREGLFTATAYLLNVLFSGFVTYEFFEPLADSLEGTLGETMFAGFEDFLAQIAIFAVCLIALRWAVNELSPNLIDYPLPAQQFGAAAGGFLAGYLLAGFLICSFQTLPWHERFLGFEPPGEVESAGRSVLPPDRVWLALMRYAGANVLSWREFDPSAESPYDRVRTFDPGATYELRYLRYRRHGDERPPLDYSGELEAELHRRK